MTCVCIDSRLSVFEILFSECAGTFANHSGRHHQTRLPPIRVVVVACLAAIQPFPSRFYPAHSTRDARERRPATNAYRNRLFLAYNHRQVFLQSARRSSLDLSECVARLSKRVRGTLGSQSLALGLSNWTVYSIFHLSFVIFQFSFTDLRLQDKWKMTNGKLKVPFPNSPLYVIQPLLERRRLCYYVNAEANRSTHTCPGELH